MIDFRSLRTVRTDVLLETLKLKNALIRIKDYFFDYDNRKDDFLCGYIRKDAKDIAV